MESRAGSTRPRSRRDRFVRWAFVAALAAAVWIPQTAAASLLEGPLMRAADSMELRGAVLHGNLEKLDTLARRHDDAGSLLARAYLAELEGRLEDAERFVAAAREQAVGADQKRAAELAHGRLLKATGRWDEAERFYRQILSDHPDAHHHRVALGGLLIERGQRQEVEPLLDKLSRDFNAGRIDSAGGLHALARAMRRLGSYKDANHAFELVHDKNAQQLPALVDWGDLLLAKYNTADAEKTFQDALDVDKRHPGALIGMARVVMETQNYYGEARRYLDRAEEVFPASPELKLARAKLAIFDGKWDRALELTDAILDRRPKHLEALAYRAGVYYLKDDREAYERVKARALELRPDYAGLLTQVAEFAVLVHRYREAVDLHRQALELQDNHPEALLGLGIGLSRLGRLDEARTKLERAFDVDPYNVRAYNMVQFFDETLPDYRVFRHDRFLLRAKTSEAEVVDRLVSPLVAESLQAYTDKYGFEPADELSVEVYPDPKEFGVRTVGLPNISPHGICFGRVVAARSPSEGNFNWRQVVWHEMAHVYHIQEANYRIPRWFTEGLAEYETNIKDPAWIRHHEPRIASALRDGAIPSVVDLNRRFSQAKSYRDILQAYHLSSLVLHFIVEQWSFDRVEAMIEAFRDRSGTAQVLREVLEVEVETFDAKFREWLAERLSGFDDQLLIDLRSFPPPATLEQEVPPSARDGWYHARRAVGLVGQGEAEAATSTMERALEIGGTDPRVQYVAAGFYASRGRAKKAYDHGLKVLDQGRDDYGLRVRLGRLSRALENLEEARIHLEAAVQLYPDGSGAWKQLASIAETTGDDALYRRASRRLFELDQTSPKAARRYTELAIEEQRWRDAAEGVRRWYAIEPFEPKVHRTDVQVSLELDRPDEALEAFELLVKLRPSQRAEVWQKAAERFRKAGYDEHAKRASQRVR